MRASAPFLFFRVQYFHFFYFSVVRKVPEKPILFLPHPKNYSRREFWVVSDVCLKDNPSQAMARHEDAIRGKPLRAETVFFHFIVIFEIDELINSEG